MTVFKAKRKDNGGMGGRTAGSNGKAEAKKPNLYGDFEDGKLLCPNCEEDLMDLMDCGFNNCPYCGQAIDFSEVEE